VKALGLLFVVFGLGAACGGETAPVDAAIIVPDAEPPDAEVDRCAMLCACTEEFCSDDLTQCMADCANLDVSVRECRIEHCGYAQTNPSFHCPHALGDGNSPGVPPECVQN